MNKLEEEISGLLIKVIEQMTHFVSDFSYQGHSIGRGIFIINIINDRLQCTMKDIIENLNLPPSTATRQVNNLVKFKFIKRIVPENNRRTVQLELTDLGKEVQLYHMENQSMVIGTLIQGFSEEELKIFVKVLRKIVGNIHELTQLFKT